MWFESLVDAASENAVAKDNAAESAGMPSMNQVSGGERTRAKCGYCNTDLHSPNWFEAEVRKKLCRAWGKICEQCGRENHIRAACRANKIMKRRNERNKKASVKEVSVETGVTEDPAVAALQSAQTVPSAALNSV